MMKTRWCQLTLNFLVKANICCISHDVHVTKTDIVSCYLCMCE